MRRLIVVAVALALAIGATGCGKTIGVGHFKEPEGNQQKK